MIGWNTENMSRQGNSLKPLTKYLETTKPRTAQQLADAESRALMRMFDKAIAKQQQGNDNGAR